MTLGEKIRLARKTCNLSQEQLAEKLFVSRSAIAKWETDKGLPDLENLKQLSRLLNTSMDNLLNEQENSSDPAIREPYSLAAYGQGCKRVKLDRMMRDRFPDAQICSLLGRPELHTQSASPHNTLGFLTPVPFGQPEYMKTVREMARTFYLVEQDGDQLFVTITKEFLEIHPLPHLETENTFVLDGWLFIRGSCLTDDLY